MLNGRWVLNSCRCYFLIADVCENLALGKNISTSMADSMKAGMGDAMLVVDGYTFTYGGCVSLDLSGGRQYLEVDLGQRHAIQVVNIYHEIVRKYVFCHFSLPLIPSKLSQTHPSRDISPGKRVPVG